MFFIFVGCCWQGNYRVFSDKDKDGVHDAVEEALEAGEVAEAAAPEEETAVTTT